MTEMIKCLPCMKPVKAGSDEARIKDKAISRQLREWHSEEAKVVKLLLLGTGESGKSTVTKQMKIIHINGFNDKERAEKVLHIRKNTRDAILTILGAMDHLHIQLECPENEESVRYLKAYAAAERHDYPQEFFDHTERLWADGGVQECYQQSYKYQLIDSAKYFLDRIERIRRDDYTPSDQDILRCRVMTNCIQRIDFGVKDGRANVQFSVFDVGGQQGERRKWISVFDSATAILFVVDCSSFDQVLREDPTKNRLLEAIQIFEQVWNSRFLRYISTIIFLNKIDKLAEKITNGKSLNELIDDVDKDNPYYNLLQSFKTFTKPKDSERREFIEAFPRGEPGSEPRRKSDIFRGRTSSCPPVLDDEVVRTAVFIKRIFSTLCQHPIMYPDHNNKWHCNHTCEFYYTCAVDTHTIKKVLEGCRSVIIKRYLETWGI